MQSHKSGRQPPVLPQCRPHGPLIDVAPADRNTECDFYQIFSDSNYILKVSATLETLKQYKFDATTNEVIKLSHFKRVRVRGEIDYLSSVSSKKRIGKSSSFRGTSFDVCALKSDDHICGYMLRKRYGREDIPETIFYRKIKQGKRKDKIG